MSDRAALTAGYLAVTTRHGATAGDLLATLPRGDMVGTGAGSRYLSRPLFLGHAETAQLHADLRQLRAALISLPDRLYGGDVAAFAAAAGLTGPQLAAVTQSQPLPVTGLTRADMYAAEDGLRLLEFNMGSAVDGLESADICRAMLRQPLLREFAREHGLSYPDTMAAELDLLRAETGIASGACPMVAVVDWPDHFARIRPFLHTVTRRWRQRGLDAHACHLGQLTMSGGRVRLRGRPVDVIFRIFLAEHLLEPGGPELMNPVLNAVARGEVAMFTALDAELYGSKAPLAMLSDRANRHLFTSAELAAIDRVLPWTRMLRPGPTILPDGTSADLYDYALAHAHDLVLKPNLLHGSIGVVPGWQPGLTRRAWRDALAGAMGGPYVLQQRVRPVPEWCPGPDGALVPWTAVWGVFSFPAGYGGVFARAVPADAPTAVTRTGTDLYIGCCLTGRPESGNTRPGAIGPEPK